MPAGGDGQRRRAAAEPPDRRREPSGLAVGGQPDHGVDVGLGRRRRAGLDVGCGERRRIAALVEPELGDELGEVAGIERLRQRLDRGEALAVDPAEPGAGERRLDLVAPRRVVVDADRHRRPRRLEGLAQRVRRLEVAAGDHQRRVASAPVGERRHQRRRRGVAGLLDQHRPRPGEEAGRLERVDGPRRLAPEVGPGDALEPHLRRAVRPDQRLDERGALQGHPHRVGAEEQDARHRGVGLREEARGVTSGQLHAGLPAGGPQRGRVSFISRPCANGSGHMRCHAEGLCMRSCIEQGAVNHCPAMKSRLTRVPPNSAPGQRRRR